MGLVMVSMDFMWLEIVSVGLMVVSVVLMGVCWWLVGFDVVTGGLMVASVGLIWV